MARPQGVRVLRPDGDPIECDDTLVHVGVDGEGIDQWHVELDTPFRPGVDKLTCTVLPGRTSIGILVPGAMMPPEVPNG
jgi:hypothetical protein